MKKRTFYPLALLLFLACVLCCGCVYDAMNIMKEGGNLDPPKWIEVSMYIYSGLVIAATIVVCGALMSRGDEDIGCGCMITLFL